MNRLTLALCAALIAAPAFANVATSNPPPSRSASIACGCLAYDGGSSTSPDRYSRISQGLAKINRQRSHLRQQRRNGMPSGAFHRGMEALALKESALWSSGGRGGGSYVSGSGETHSASGMRDNGKW